MFQAILRFAGFSRPAPPSIPTSELRRRWSEMTDDERRRVRALQRIEDAKSAASHLPEVSRDLEEARRYPFAIRGVAVGLRLVSNASGRYREQPYDRARIGEGAYEYLRALTYAGGHLHVVTDGDADRLAYLKAYRADVEERAVTDLDTWAAGIVGHRKACAFAKRSGDPEPLPLVIPRQIRDGLEKRAAEKARHAGRFGGATSGGVKAEPAHPKGPTRT